MKKIIYICLVLGCLNATDLFGQSPKSRKVVPIEKSIESSVYLNERKVVNKNTVLERRGNSISKKLKMTKDYSGEFYEYGDYLVKIKAVDINQMKSEGYSGVRKMYDAYAIENRDNKNVYLDYQKNKNQEGFVIHVRGGNSYSFVVENMRYNVTGTIYSYNNNEEETLKFVKKFMKSLKLK